MALQEASGNNKRVTGAGQAWAAPRNLGQLMELFGQANGQPSLERALQHRIVAGNTGAGACSLSHSVTHLFAVRTPPDSVRLTFGGATYYDCVWSNHRQTMAFSRECNLLLRRRGVMQR